MTTAFLTPTSLALAVSTTHSSGEECPVAKMMSASAQISMTLTTSGNTFPCASSTGTPPPFFRMSNADW